MLNPSQDELEKIHDLKKKIVAQGEHSKKVFERKIHRLETKMKKNRAEQDEKIQMLEETITVQRETIEKFQSEDRKITELEQKFQSLSQYINPAISSIIS